MIAIVDYGLGNLRSVENAIEYLGSEFVTTGDPAQIAAAGKVILPGVGSFRVAMENIEHRGLIATLHHAALVAKKPFLGICLGMQLLAESGDEDGPSRGLGFVEGHVKRLEVSTSLKIPHIGFNTTAFTARSSLFAGLGERAEFYFVHSYRMVCRHDEDVSGWCEYGERFAASVQRENVFGTQFHPEKSQTNGLRVIENFLALPDVPC